MFISKNEYEFAIKKLYSISYKNHWIRTRVQLKRILDKYIDFCKKQDRAHFKMMAVQKNLFTNYAQFANSNLSSEEARGMFVAYNAYYFDVAMHEGMTVELRGGSLWINNAPFIVALNPERGMIGGHDADSFIRASEKGKKERQSDKDNNLNDLGLGKIEEEELQSIEDLFRD